MRMRRRAVAVRGKLLNMHRNHVVAVALNRGVDWPITFKQNASLMIGIGFIPKIQTTYD